MKNLKFQKFSGAGNDFIMIDGFEITPEEISDIINIIPELCSRGTGVGADGLIIIRPHDKLDFQMRYFNSDGSEAEMCGNGGRCAARFAYLNEHAGKQLKFETISGVYSAEIIGNNVKLQMQNADIPEKKSIKTSQGMIKGYLINTGVPHIVIFEQDNDFLNPDEINSWGREIRFHDLFTPAGTNVNIIKFIDEHNMEIRTYERGVELETLACGTGSTAAGIVSVVNGICKSPVKLKTRSGLILTIDLKLTDEKNTDIYLTGEARLVYTGILKES